MNKIFKVIWNRTTQRLEVVSELAKGTVKSSSNSVVNLVTDVSKPVLKLSLLSICLGYPTWVMAATNTDDGLFRLQGNELHADLGRGKYIVGVYDRETGSYGFGKAQVGKKDEIWENGKLKKPKAVGNYQLAIGHDIIIASGYKGIAIGSNYDSSASGGGNTYYFSPLAGRQGGTQGAYAVSLGSGAQAIGRHTLALGANSGNGGAYNGYDDAVFLGSLSRIKSLGQGREKDNINVNDLETKYTEAVKEYNDNQTQANLNKVIEAGRNINNAALNKVEEITIKSNVASPALAGKFTTQTEQVSQVNGSKDSTTVSILSVGGTDDKNNTMYRQIQNVAAGRIASDSNDAVTGSQLYYVRNYTGWNIGHYDDATKANKTTGRVNNDHTVIFKPGEYTDVYTTLDSTNQSTVGIEVKTANLGTEVANGKISKITITDPISTEASKTVARTAGVKSVLDKFNEVKADNIDIMGYSHVNSNGNTRDEALLKADGTKATFNYEGRNNSSITNASEGKTKDNNGKYAEASGAQADRSIASGVYANALAKDSIAIGTGANVNNYWGSQFRESINGIAIGKLAQVEGSEGAIAFGAGSTILRNLSYNVGSANAIAIGNGSKITAASGAIAIGNNTNITAIDTAVTGNGAVNAIAIGNGATVERRNSIALGQGTKASGVSSIALGDGTKVSGDNTVAIGTNVTAAKENSVVIGQNASATKERVVAIGAYAAANGDRTVAIGPEATANGSKSIVIGGLGDNKTDGNNFDKATSADKATQAIVIGNGAQATDPASYSITLGNSAKTEAGTGISIGDRANVASGATSGIALGKSAVANKSGDIAIGESSSTSDKHTVSGLKIGDATLSTGVAATGNGTVSFGNNTIKRQIQNVGAGEISDKSSDVITGSQLYHVIKAADEIAKTEYKFQVNGIEKKIMRNNGTSTTNNANNTLDFRAGDGLEVAYENNAVTYKLNADSKQAITDAKNAAQTVTTKLSEINTSAEQAKLAASRAASSATEAGKSATSAASSATEAGKSASAASSAASAAQSTAQRIEDSGLISKDGKTAFAADNTSNRDSAKAKGKDATAVGYGSNASGENATAIGNNATASGRNSTALGQNATATAENSVAIGQGSVANERNTVSVGSVGNERRITNVADPVNNTDAANKRYVDNAMRKTEKKLRGGVAGATAMANIPQVTQPGKLMVGAGIGNYKGQSAVAIGLSKSSDSNRVIFKMSGSATTQGDYNIGAGIGYQW